MDELRGVCVCVCFILPRSCIPFLINTLYYLWRRRIGIVFTTDDIKYRAKKTSVFMTLSHKNVARMHRAFWIHNRKTSADCRSLLLIQLVIDVCVNVRITNWLLPSRVNSVSGHAVRMLYLSLKKWLLLTYRPKSNKSNVNMELLRCG